MKAGQLVRAWSSRIAAGALGASVAGLFAATFDTAWARGAGDAKPLEVKALAVLLADAGLIAPVALAVGIGVGIGSVLVFPDRPPSVSSLMDWLRDLARGKPADVAAFVPLLVVAGFVWMTLSAQLARALLGLDVPASLAGFAIATGALVFGLLSALLALAITPALRQALAQASEGRPGFVDPVRTGAVGLAVVIVLFALGVSTGSVSGEGGPLGVYGVFKRPELDLRAVGLLALITISTLAFGTVRSLGRTFVFAALALLPLALLGRSAVALGGEGVPVAQLIERSAPLGKLALKGFRRLADRDRDGASALFGGGDCLEGDARVGPLGVEIADNGVDEDCSGTDLKAEALAAFNPAKPVVDPAVKAATNEVMPKDLNVLLITIDTLRADLGFMGYPQPVSPNLDALAARGTVFTTAYSLASYTGKSIGPMLIGKYGSETERNWGHFNRFSEEETFLAQRISRAGVRTIGVHAHRYFGKFGGLDRGFDVVDMTAAPPEGAPWDVADQSSSVALSDAALAQLAKPENTSGRFFMWIHYLDPHADYLRHDDVPSFGSGQRALYDGEVAFTDKHIGRVVEAVQKAAWGSRTAIIVTSDHGEAFGEHKMYRHGFELWEPLVRVPLVVYVPNSKPSRIEARRSLIDIAPTVLDLFKVELPQPADGSPDRLSGTSMLTDVFLPPGQRAEQRDILVDMPAGPFNDARRAFIHGDLKLTISNNSAYELYDLAKDPAEATDLWRAPETRGDMAERYAAARARLREIRVVGPRK